MAVENKWVDTDLEAGRKSAASKVAGGQVRELAITFEVAAADSDGSIYKLARIPANAVITKAELNCDAIAGSTDWDLGFYDDDEATAVDADILADGVDINAGAALGSEVNMLGNGSTYGVDDIGKKVWEILGKTISNKKEGYILALTANTVGSADGTVSLRLQYLEG